MRALHRAEALVMQSLLAGEAGEGVAARLPRRTRQTVQRRVEAWGWVVERLVPSLACVRAPVLTFVVARPYEERAAALRRRWQDAPNTVHAWSADGSLFGVVSAPSAQAGRTLGSSLVPPEEGRIEFSLAVDLRTDFVPVFFDFEAAWVRIARLEGVRSYPQGWDAPKRSAGADEVPEPPERLRRALENLLAADAAPAPLPGGTSPREAVASDSDVERLLRGGWAHRRRYLEPTSVSRVVTTLPTQVVLVWGAPTDPGHLRELFPSLVSEGPAAPFLFVATRTGVLLGFLGGGVPARGTEGAGILPVLRRHLERIESTRVPIASIRPLVLYRYQSLLAAGPDRSSGGERA